MLFLYGPVHWEGLLELWFGYELRCEELRSEHFAP